MGWFSRKVNKESEEVKQQKNTALKEAKIERLRKWVDYANVELFNYQDSLCMHDDGEIYAYRRCSVGQNDEGVVKMFFNTTTKRSITTKIGTGFVVDPGDGYIEHHVNQRIKWIKEARQKWLDFKATLILFEFEVVKKEKQTENDKCTAPD